MRVVGFNMIILDSDLYNLFGCQCIFLKIGMITNIVCSGIYWRKWCGKEIRAERSNVNNFIYIF